MVPEMEDAGTAAAVKLTPVADVLLMVTVRDPGVKENPFLLGVMV
jgi:hypothetical protein